ncbi:transposase-like protein [Fusobacterium naviforme]|nr:IS256 family transposase [Fusobacterium naviforme]PSL08612.1 transposase-like protein [Fusobacterium naviforme]STO27125.1 Transposase and inactivated derivatives [Fusobacterium naviforme]STO27464.1 Transposase and inactivated derivatives [Fusobacterium naviforme]STO27808.1 Transposase and inactivated derivatives [Fusobacterium naviforme]
MSGNIIQLNEDLIKNNLKDLVRNSVEETLNALLDHEADELVRADKYQRSAERQGYRSGHYDRNFTTSSGDVTLHVPKLKGVQFETAIIERYRRRESSVEEALIEMYLAGVSVRRIEDVTEALWGSKVSPGTISNLNKKAYEHIEEWRMRPLSGEYPYVYVDGIYLKRCWGGEIQNVSVLIAIGVTEDGYREIIGAAEGMKEDHESWKNFFIYLKERGLSGVRLVIGDKCLGMLESIPEVFPEARYQRCTVHFYRNIFSVTPRMKMQEVTRMLKAIHSQEDKQAAREKAKMVVAKLREMKLSTAAKKLEDGIEETLTYMEFPVQHWHRIRTNNLTERVNREVRRRTRSIGAFPDGNSALMLVCARLRYVASNDWGQKRYLNMKHLYDLETENQLAIG